jgi:hypothetical protein
VVQLRSIDRPSQCLARFTPSAEAEEVIHARPRRDRPSDHQHRNDCRRPEHRSTGRRHIQQRIAIRLRDNISSAAILMAR